MKKTWDDLVAEKQAERERQRMEEVEDYSSSEDLSLSERNSPHLIPEIFVDSSTPEKTVTQGSRGFEQNSKKAYAELSKKLAERLSNQKEPEDEYKANKKTQWNKKIGIKDVAAEIGEEKYAQLNGIHVVANAHCVKKDSKVDSRVSKSQCKQIESDKVFFNKSYSFKNLPKGRVAKLQQQFETNIDEMPMSLVKKPSPKTITKLQKKILEKEGHNLKNKTSLSTSQKFFPTNGKKERKMNTEGQKYSDVLSAPKMQKTITNRDKPIVPIRTWEESRHSPTPLDVLKKPGSRQGFHASTPSIVQALDSSIFDENHQHRERFVKQQSSYDRRYIQDYLGALKDQRDQAREKASEFKIKNIKKQSWHPFRTKERYFAFENVDLTGKVISWTEIVSVSSSYDVSISEPVFV